VGLPWKLSFTLAWVPPIPLNGVIADLLAMSLQRPFRLTRALTLGVAVYGQVGEIRGDFTCPESVVGVADPQQNPFGCVEKSHDRTLPYYAGIEGSASYRIRPLHNLEPYVTASVNYMNLKFEVNAHYSDTFDHTRLETQGATFAMTGGLLFPVNRRFDLGAEVFYSPLTVRRPQNDNDKTLEGLFNVRAMAAIRFF
jgi:hypothetical protein